MVTLNEEESLQIESVLQCTLVLWLQCVLVIFFFIIIYLFFAVIKKKHIYIYIYSYYKVLYVSNT